MKEGWLYIFEAGGYFKIGISADPSKRMKELQTGSPAKLRTVFTVKLDNVKTVEHQLHRTFATKRVVGEWFTLDEADIQTAIEMCQKSFDVPEPSPVISRKHCAGPSRVWIEKTMVKGRMYARWRRWKDRAKGQKEYVAYIAPLEPCRTDRRLSREELLRLA